MSNKKIVMYVSIITLIIFILGIGWIILRDKNNVNMEMVNEYIPEQEISEEQLRKTNITLYFEEVSTGNLVTEIRQIDSKELLDNAEKKLIEFLIEGPNNKELNKIIPENTKILETKIEKGILLINFSEDFIKDQNLGEEKERLLLDSIIKTVSQLNEINGIKILIEGEEGRGFYDSNINFDKIFLIYYE